MCVLITVLMKQSYNIEEKIEFMISSGKPKQNQNLQRRKPLFFSFHSFHRSVLSDCYCIIEKESALLYLNIHLFFLIAGSSIKANLATVFLSFMHECV